MGGQSGAIGLALSPTDSPRHVGLDSNLGASLAGSAEQSVLGLPPAATAGWLGHEAPRRERGGTAAASVGASSPGQQPSVAGTGVATPPLPSAESVHAVHRTSRSIGLYTKAEQLVLAAAARVSMWQVAQRWHALEGGGAKRGRVEAMAGEPRPLGAAGFNPFAPTPAARRLLADRGRWAHLFQDSHEARGGRVPPWRSLCEPAVLPLTTSCAVAPAELTSAFSVTNYSLALQQRHPVAGPCSPRDIVIEMAGQRIAHEFQVLTPDPWAPGGDASAASELLAAVAGQRAMGTPSALPDGETRSQPLADGPARQGRSAQRGKHQGEDADRGGRSSSSNSSDGGGRSGGRKGGPRDWLRGMRQSAGSSLWPGSTARRRASKAEEPRESGARRPAAGTAVVWPTASSWRSPPSHRSTLVPPPLLGGLREDAASPVIVLTLGESIHVLRLDAEESSVDVQMFTRKSPAGPRPPVAGALSAPGTPGSPADSSPVSGFTYSAAVSVLPGHGSRVSDHASLAGAGWAPYRFRLWCHATDSFQTSEQVFARPSGQEVGWNALDWIVCGNQVEFTESARFKRITFVLLPHARPETGPGQEAASPLPPWLATAAKGLDAAAHRRRRVDGTARFLAFLRAVAVASGGSRMRVEVDEGEQEQAEQREGGAASGESGGSGVDSGPDAAPSERRKGNQGGEVASGAGEDDAGPSTEAVPPASQRQPVQLDLVDPGVQWPHVPPPSPDACRRARRRAGVPPAPAATAPSGQGSEPSRRAPQHVWRAHPQPWTMWGQRPAGGGRRPRPRTETLPVAPKATRAREDPLTGVLQWMQLEVRR